VAKPVAKITLGIDVAKDQHVVCNWHTKETLSVPNQRSEIKTWLKSFHGPIQIAIEPTSHYHLTVVEEAQALGHPVYLINPRQLVHYREAVNLRHKTDPLDAWLLARYLQHERAQLRPFQPQDPKAQRLWALVLRRAAVVQSRQQLQQSFAEVHLSIQGLLTQFERLLERIERQMVLLIRELGWRSDYLRCQSIPGIGPANAAALTSAYHRGAFAGSDAFIAYMGLDIRIRESGRYKGKRKLTKRGESELRRLLYCASKSAQTHQRFADYHQKLLDKGLCKTAARVALGRKLARIAFTLMSRQEFFKIPKETHCTSP
jgi:transposase